MNSIMKIKEGTRERKFPGPIGVEATGVTEAGVVGIMGPAGNLGPSRMFVATKNDM